MKIPASSVVRVIFLKKKRRGFDIISPRLPVSVWLVLARHLASLG